MDASQLIGTIIRILNQPVFPPRAKSAHGKARPNAGRPHVAPPVMHAEAPGLAVPTGHAPITVTPAAAAARPNPVLDASPAAAPATTQAMRTLEEVRADLARLRDQARRRQAATAQARRDRAFAPTDFMEYGEPAAAGPARAFAPTDFLDFGTGKPS